ncbi:secreted protein [Candidatus Omnitrophus magneticus]|uniref:Secreted protein n=1 Tax=Candidatus Omnitrophus magneticus TaxID=1609969 RepID=A0A0F0CTL2_9BACT|nr:secreted protein [Candidatus Omnitrophus magneticus]
MYIFFTKFFKERSCVMKKFIMIIVIVSALFSGISLANIAEAGNTGAFNITITVDYISIDLYNADGSSAFSGWNAGQVATSTVKTMAGDEGIKVVNTSNKPVDITCYVNSGASWALGGSPYIDQFSLKAKSFDTAQAGVVDMDSAVTITQIGGNGNVIADALPVDAARYIYYQFLAPTSTTNRNAQSIGITIEAVVS